MINISKLYCSHPGQSDHLRYSASDSSGPVVVYNCTPKCNLKCIHCYNAAEQSSTDRQLTTEEAKRLLQQLAEVNCPVLLLSGGEPLLRPDIFELLGEAKRIGLRTALSSNGTLIDAGTAEKIADSGVSYVGISIDGPESFHDKFRKVPGCFKAALGGIKNCRDAGLRTGLRFTITKENVRHVPFVFELAAELNIRRICFYHLVRVGRAELTKPPTSRQTRQALDTIVEKTADAVNAGAIDEVLTVGNHADGPYLLMKMQKENNPNLEAAKELLLINGGNRIGEKIAAVDYSGNVYPDQFWSNYQLGNIKEKSFRNIWQNPTERVLKKLRNKTEFADQKCKKCRWFDYCKGNFRFLAANPAENNWLLEPACCLTEEEISVDNSKLET